MSRVAPYQPSFNAGEFSPRMAARTDFSQYKNACETLENFIPLPEGGAMRRSGTRFVNECKDSSKQTDLKHFEFSTTQAYVLEFGDRYIRFKRNQGVIVTNETDAVITNGSFDTNITGWTDSSTGSASIAWNANGYMNLVGASASVAAATQGIVISTQEISHVIRFRVIGAAGDSISFRVGTSSGAQDILADKTFKTGYHCYEFTPTSATFYIQFRNSLAKTVSVDNVVIIQSGPIEIESPHLEADVFRVNGPQSADTLYLFHGSYKTHKLLRNGHSSWSLEEVEWMNGPYLDENTTSAYTIKPSATSGLGITLTASGFSPFSANDVGRLVRISNPASGTNYGYARITAVTAGHQATADVESNFATSNASSTWALGAWSGSTGYPSVGSFHQQRLVAARTTSEPQTVWFSNTADFENMAPSNAAGTVADDNALAFTISSDTVDSIEWISSGKTLVIGTSGGEWDARSSGAVITPTDIDMRRNTAHGSAAVQPVRIGPVVIFLQRAKRKLRQLAFDFEVEGLRTIDLTRLANHIAIGGIVKMDYQQEPNGIIWCVRSDGQLLAMTFLPDDKVIAWSRNIIGGSYAGGNSVVESVVTIPGNSSTNSEDRNEVWLVVKRTINGETKRYVEFFEYDFETGNDQEDAFYVDCGLTYEGSANTVITNLDHLEGQSVQILANGAVLANETVTSGSVTLDTSSTKAQIGLGYTSKLKTLKIEAGAQSGTAVGKTKRIRGATLVVLNSHVFKIGTSESNLEEQDFRQVGDAMDAAAPLFTGEKFVELEGDHETDSRIFVQVDKPVPFTLLAIAPELQTQDRP